MSDIRVFHRAAVQASVEVVAAGGRDDLDRPTPCAGWDLLDLLAHMTAQHHGFAAAARGSGDGLTIWEADRLAGAVAADPGGAYAAAAADVLDAFGADGVLDATFALPEFGPGAAFPGAMAIGFHFVDYVVHGWDVARSIGADFALPDDVVAAVLPLVFMVPDGDFRAAAGAPFGQALPAPAGGNDLDRILSHLGRSPDWKP